jgi:aldehyde dehydrogenase (NAD+)
MAIIDAQRAGRSFDRIYIGGEWVQSDTAERIAVLSPATGREIGHVPAGSPTDVERAVAAAREAFEGWSTTSVEERVALLGRLRTAVLERQDELAELIVADVGVPIQIAAPVQVALTIRLLEDFATIADELAWTEQIGHSRVAYEPVGVVGAITPWNFPLNQVAAKLAPAIAAGNTVVLKPTELAPLSPLVLAEAADHAGLPPGVLNVVTGLGRPTGEALVRHDDVDMVTFTGSTSTGRRISELAAPTIKRVALELGGKSASVVLPGADLRRAVETTVHYCYLNSGQVCVAHSRLLVPRELHDEAVGIAAETANAYVVGDPFDTATTMGPLISAAQRDRVREDIIAAEADGATLVTGGARAPHRLEDGYYVQPTVFAEVRPEMTIAQEEVFGPVLSIMPYADEEEAVRIANATRYGLSGAVWAATDDEAVRIARRLRTGEVNINGGEFNPAAPSGGYKQSGNGRERGRWGFLEYLEVKAIQFRA